MIRFKKDDGSCYPDWEEKTFGDVFSSLEYGMNAAATEYDGEHKYIRITDINDETHEYMKNDIVSPSGKLEDKYILKTGDIVFARTGASVGKTYAYKEKDGKLYYAGFLIKGSTKSEFCPEFIFAQTLTHKYNNWVSVMSVRSGQPGINSQEYASYKFMCPISKEEQQKIADFLSSVDDVITASEQEVANLEEQKKGVMQKIFSREVRFKADDGSDYPEWEEKLLGELSDLYTGKSFTNALEENGKYIVMDMGTVAQNGFRIESKHTNLLRDVLKKDDLVMPKDDIGGGLIICKTVHIPENNKYVLGDHVYRLHFEGQDGLFMHYLINSEKVNRSFKRKVTGSAQLGIKAQNVLNQILLIPCLEEQQKISQLLSNFDTAINLANQELLQWKELKKGLLQQLFV